MPDFVSVNDPRHEKISPKSGSMFAMSDFVSDQDPGPGGPLLQQGVGLYMQCLASVLRVPGFVSVSDLGPGTISPESGNVLAMSDFVSDFDPGPGEPLLRSGVGLNMPSFAGGVDKLRMQDFVSAIDPGPGTTSPGFGYTLAVTDFVSDIDPGPGEPLLESAVALDRPHFVGDNK